MYYLFDDSGALINEFENVSEGLSQKDMFPESVLIYNSHLQDAWEWGIEVKAPKPENREFIWYFTYQLPETRIDEYSGHEYNTDGFSGASPTLEQAIELLKDLMQGHKGSCPERPILKYGIEERITIIHKVKIP